ncbi:MAG: ankyrin repeat domain-containing protein, partial [Burkholderiaceae bacterium]
MARQETTDPEQSITQNGNTPSGVSHDRATEQHERATAHSLRQAILQNTQSQAVNSHPADMVLTNIFTFVQHLSNFIPAQQFHAGLFNLFVSVRNLASQFIPAPQLNQFLLDCAVTRGDAASIKMLCSEANSLSLDPNAFVGNTTVPLLYNLVALSKDDAVKALLQHPHIDPNLHNSNCGLVPLHQAVCNGDSGSFETLLNHQKIDINAESSQGKTTALHFAARQGKIDFVKELLQKENINVNKPAVGGITALSQALISPNEREDVRIQLVTTLLQDPRTDPNSAIGLIEQKHSHADQLTDFYLKTRMAKTLEELDSLDSKAKKIIMLEDWAN